MQRGRIALGSVLLLLLLGTGPAPTTKPVLLGYTFTHTAVNCPLGAVEHGPRKSAGVDAAHNVVLHYDEPQIRAQAQRILAAMRAEGAELVRTILWFRDVGSQAKPSGADVLGLLPARGGILSERDVRNIVAYASDVRAAGYRDLVLVPGPQVEANPKCRAAKWGACFDAATIPLSWSVTAQIKRAVQPLVREDFRVIFDIAPEMCPGPAPQPAGSNMTEYARYMIAHYLQAFADRDFIVSCGGGPSPQLALTRLRALGTLYRELGARPAALDVHMYFAHPSDYAMALLGAESEAAGLNADLFVLETYVGNSAMLGELHLLLTTGRLPKFRALSLWPLRISAGCAESETAPFPLANARRAVADVP